MLSGDWRRIQTSNLPTNLRDNLEIYRNDALSERLLGLSAPTMRCVSFFPNITPADVLLTMCSVSRRLAWDKNYEWFQEFSSQTYDVEDGRKARTNEDEVSTLVRNPIRLLCHRMGHPWMTAIGLKSKAYCYTRLVTPLFPTRQLSDSIKSFDDVERGASGYHVTFLNQGMPKKCDALSDKDTLTKIHFQYYTIQAVKRGEVSGAELTMTSCIDVKLPRFFPRSLQDYMASLFTSNAFLMLQKYLEQNFA